MITLQELRANLKRGLVIPACPLALTRQRAWDERHQRALFRYYAAAGAGGLAVGVHTTQFAIHQEKVGLYQPVLNLAAEELQHTAPGMVRVAGLVGATQQALREAALARDLGYDAGLMSLAAYGGASDSDMLAHCRAVADVLPLFGFYLQPAAGGRLLSREFWRQFCAIANVAAIKIAPFNRYQTLDVVRAVHESGRQDEIALYTGNDDNIIGDLITPYRFGGPDEQPLYFSGGLLGHWAVWTSVAARHLARCQEARREAGVSHDLLALAAEVTDANAALFDAANGFSGCISGVQYLLARQGLLADSLTLDPSESLSPGQAQEIERVRQLYPHLTDDAFVQQHLDEWLH